MSWIQTELPKITDPEIQKALKSTLLLFWKNDSYLLRHDMNEVTITHKLGCYLQTKYKNFNVDCEYNRNHDDPKQIQQDGRNRNIKPDIIVHERGSNASNFLVIEAKKLNNGERESDLEKLQAYLNPPLTYQNSLYIEFKTHGIIDKDNFIVRLEFYARSI